MFNVDEIDYRYLQVKSVKKKKKRKKKKKKERKKEKRKTRKKERKKKKERQKERKKDRKKVSADKFNSLGSIFYKLASNGTSFLSRVN